MSEMILMIETGPKGKRVVGIAPDWPGLERGAKNEAELLETLETYLPRYAKVAARAGMEGEFLAQEPWQITERYPGPGSTDFWGISFAPAPHEYSLPSAGEWERQISLLQAAWAEFDAIAARVSPEMQRGPRGGGRMRDQIISHTYKAEIGEYSGKLGYKPRLEDLATPEGLAAHRGTFTSRLREYHQNGVLKLGRSSWTLPFLLRHTAYHVLDHAWEMEDKDLTPLQGPAS